MAVCPVMAQGSEKESSPVSELPDDILVEIISRVPYKSICSCKCVSMRWRALVSNPDHRKKLPSSTLAGFFYQTEDRHHPYHAYKSISGNSCPRFSLCFLPEYDNSEIDIHMLDCCNGLLLFRRVYPSNKLDYMVCNPATKRWAVVPAIHWSNIKPEASLGFDPAVSSHFHVFEFASAALVDSDSTDFDTHIKALQIYSSETGAWTRRSAWDHPIAICNYTGSALFNGVLYLASYDELAVAVVDVEGNCRVILIPTPNDSRVFPDVYVSRGQLYLMKYGASELSIWALEDSTRENWTLKHNISHLQLFGTENSSSQNDYCVISIHPECNVIFIECAEKYPSIDQYSRLEAPRKLMSYDMDARELNDICFLGCECMAPYLSYFPLFSQSLADGH